VQKKNLLKKLLLPQPKNLLLKQAIEAVVPQLRCNTCERIEPKVEQIVETNLKHKKFHLLRSKKQFCGCEVEERK
jgi:hypothetical protein